MHLFAGEIRSPRLKGSRHVQSPPGPALARRSCARRSTHRRQVHRLLMARGEIIDRLIQVKQTQEVGSAFRPAREAGMMRRPGRASSRHAAARHHREHRRVIISTFTYVQAPFSVHADVSVGEPAMRDSARFHFGFVVPYVGAFQRAGRGRGGGEIEGRSGAGLGDLEPDTMVDRAGG